MPGQEPAAIFFRRRDCTTNKLRVSLAQPDRQSVKTQMVPQGARQNQVVSDKLGSNNRPLSEIPATHVLAVGNSPTERRVVARPHRLAGAKRNGLGPVRDRARHVGRAAPMVEYSRGPLRGWGEDECGPCFGVVCWSAGEAIGARTPLLPRRRLSVVRAGCFSCQGPDSHVRSAIRTRLRSLFCLGPCPTGLAAFLPAWHATGSRRTVPVRFLQQTLAWNHTSEGCYCG